MGENVLRCPPRFHQQKPGHYPSTAQGEELAETSSKHILHKDTKAPMESQNSMKMLRHNSLLGFGEEYIMDVGGYVLSGPTLSEIGRAHV